MSMEDSLTKELEIIQQEIGYMQDEINRSYKALLKLASIIIPVIVTAYAGVIASSEGGMDIHFSVPVAASLLLTYGILMANHIWGGLHAFYWRKSSLLKRAEHLIGNNASFEEFFATNVPIDVNKIHLSFVTGFFLIIFGILLCHSFYINKLSSIFVAFALLYSAISIYITNYQKIKLFRKIDQL